MQVLALYDIEVLLDVHTCRYNHSVLSVDMFVGLWINYSLDYIYLSGEFCDRTRHCDHHDKTQMFECFVSDLFVTVCVFCICIV